MRPVNTILLFKIQSRLSLHEHQPITVLPENCLGIDIYGQRSHLQMAID